MVLTCFNSPAKPAPLNRMTGLPRGVLEHKKTGFDREDIDGNNSLLSGYIIDHLSCSENG